MNKQCAIQHSKRMVMHHVENKQNSCFVYIFKPKKYDIFHNNLASSLKEKCRKCSENKETYMYGQGLGFQEYEMKQAIWYLIVQRHVKKNYTCIVFKLPELAISAG